MLTDSKSVSVTVASDSHSQNIDPPLEDGFDGDLLSLLPVLSLLSLLSFLSRLSLLYLLSLLFLLSLFFLA